MKPGSSQNIIVGYDLGNQFCQISYYVQGTENIETVASVAGTENYSIPTVLCKRSGVNQWFYGKEALRYAGEQDGVLVENLLDLALDGEPVRIDGETFDPVSLLALFLKRSLGLLAPIASLDRMVMMVITVEHPDALMAELMEQVMNGLKLPVQKILLQSHKESFYYYMLHQPRDLWREKTILLEYRDNKMLVYEMDYNRRTKPIVVYISDYSQPFTSYEPMPEEEAERETKYARLDSELTLLVGKLLGEGQVSSVYLIGEHFHEAWMKESLRLLCKGRRVFQGNNLYSKGACYCVMERLCRSDEGKNYVFLGNDKLKSNIGMNILRRGEDSYIALLDAGTNWYEAEKTVEFYLQDGNELEFEVVSLVGKESFSVQMTLDGLRGDICRLRLKLFMKAENLVCAEVTDLGFGDLWPADNRVWTKEITI